jgi:hypothetical protein
VNVEVDVGNGSAGTLLVPGGRSTDIVMSPKQQIGGGKLATVRENATGTIDATLLRNSFSWKTLILVQSA